MKQTYRALTCFLIDFWDHQECEPHTNPATVQQLQTLPVEKGQSKCFNLAGPQGGRVCFVHAVLGTSLVANPDVSIFSVCVKHQALQQPFEPAGKTEGE